MTESPLESLGEIGGYFGLDLSDYGLEFPHSDAIGFQSARAAIRAALSALRNQGVTHVWIPGYTCDSVIQSAMDADLIVVNYDLDDSLYPKRVPSRLPEDCAFIYINYFGLCSQQVARLLDVLPVGTTLIDNSHALFAPPHVRAAATVYSPRKMVGLPDGGLLVTSQRLRVSAPTEEDLGSFERVRFLLRRTAYSAREGYEEFQKARASLADNTPRAMSRLTRRLMRSIRWDEVMRRRRSNYSAMAAILDRMNEHPWPLEEGQTVPLCYPFTLSREVAGMRSQLAADGIFTPTYWPDARVRAANQSIEATLIDSTLYLPIDQRYTCAQVEGVAQRVLKLIEQNP